MSLSAILARQGIGPEAGAYAAQAARLRRVAAAHGLPVERLMRVAECDALADWSDAALLAYARARLEAEDRSAGRVPLGWCAVAQCRDCGPVWLWEGAPARVLGCPWCLVRVAGGVIPRPARNE